MLKYIDIHSHLGLLTLEEDKEKIIYKMMEKGVGTFVIGVDYESSKKAIVIAEQHDFIWAGVGLHPTDNDKEVFDLEKYQKLAEHERVVCIGECGLDYFRDAREETKIKQKDLFEKHIQIALLAKKPLMIHSRPSKGSQDAYEDSLSILEKHKGELLGNFHFFVGDIVIAKRVLDIGFTMSFDGPITFSHDYDEVIKFLPLESIMCETDAPFAAPAPYRGKTCEPWMVEEVYKKIAEIKELPIEKVIEVIRGNVKRVFGV
ncbi:MAG: TatD family hydrolase [Minisyncoccia bacterium]